MPASLSFGGVNLGTVSNVTHSVSGNERERTGISDPEMLYAAGKPDREVTFEGAGLLSPVAVGDVGDVTIVGESGQTRSIPAMIVTEFEDSIDVGDGDGYSVTLKRAQPA